ncbi:MAG: hypothetical protein ABI423_00205, partial [Burkholderiales bacterium]
RRGGPHRRDWLAPPAVPRTSAKAPAPAPARTPTPTPAPAARHEAAPTLDLKSLEQQLKDTKAIGFMTKLSLKNQVDDLLAQFRNVYDGPSGASVAQLRGPFDMLLMKVLSLLQDKDPALARSIHASRESLWAILADRDKFQKLA